MLSGLGRPQDRCGRRSLPRMALLPARRPTAVAARPFTPYAAQLGRSSTGGLATWGPLTPWSRLHGVVSLIIRAGLAPTPPVRSCAVVKVLCLSARAVTLEYLQVHIRYLPHFDRGREFRLISKDRYSGGETRHSWPPAARPQPCIGC